MITGPPSKIYEVRDILPLIRERVYHDHVLIVGTNCGCPRESIGPPRGQPVRTMPAGCIHA